MKKFLFQSILQLLLIVPKYIRYKTWHPDQGSRDDSRDAWRLVSHVTTATTCRHSVKAFFVNFQLMNIASNRDGSVSKQYASVISHGDVCSFSGL